MGTNEGSKVAACSSLSCSSHKGALLSGGNGAEIWSAPIAKPMPW